MYYKLYAFYFLYKILALTHITAYSLLLHTNIIMPRSKYQPINNKPLPGTQESQGNSGKVNTVLSALNLVPRLCRFPFHAFWPWLYQQAVYGSYGIFELKLYP